MEKEKCKLSKYRINKANELLKEAMFLNDYKYYSTAMNRTYYAIFEIIRSINCLSGFESSKHSGVISYFEHNYIKTKIFHTKYSKLIYQAMKEREKSDYLDFYSIEPEMVIKLLNQSVEFINEVLDYLIKNNVLEKDEIIFIKNKN